MTDNDYDEELLVRYGMTAEELADEAERGYDTSKFARHIRTPQVDSADSAPETNEES
jgi:hypothetical protein